MKRKPLVFAFALIIVLVAALLGVNWRLNHPPLSDADKEFRALVVDADSVHVSQFSCQKQMACAASGTINYPTLNAVQTRELIELLRFTRDDKNLPAPNWSVPSVTLDLSFRRENHILGGYVLNQTPRQSGLIYASSSRVFSSYQLHPRFEKSLREFLDEVAPARIRP